METNPKPKVGISTCLLGESVRYDGQHKRDRFLVDTVSDYVQWVPVCPEVECGLPVPREAMQLRGDPQAPRLVTNKTERDLTEKMLEFSRRKVVELEEEDLCGFVFKSRSPSSGMERIKVYDQNGVPHPTGVGLFAAAVMEHFPRIPFEDDGRLHDPGLRENFFERLFCLHRFRLMSKGGKVRDLVDFHSRHKLQLMAHSQDLLAEMGRLVAGFDGSDEERFDRYEDLLMQALSVRSSQGRHANVMMHILGYFKENLDSWEKKELLEIVEEFKQGMVPRIVPKTLLLHYARKYEQDYLLGQSYLKTGQNITGRS